jgi:hypothetical protein
MAAVQAWNRTYSSLIELQQEVSFVSVTVPADYHILSPLVLDSRNDSLVDVLVEVFGNLVRCINAHKHALHLDYQTIFDGLPSQLDARSLNGHLRLLGLEVHSLPLRVLWYVELDQIAQVRPLP